MTVPYFSGTLAILLEWLSGRSLIRSTRFISSSDSKSDEKTELLSIRANCRSKLYPVD